MDHRLFGPVRLKNEIGLFLCQVALDNALLIDAWNAVVIAKRRCKVLEDPLGGSGQRFKILLRLEVPVKKVAGISLRPVAILRNPHVTTAFQIIKSAFISSMAARDLA